MGEGGIQDVLAVLGLGVGEEAKAGSVLIEALVETGLLVPAVLVVVNVVVGLRVGKVELFEACQHCGAGVNASNECLRACLPTSLGPTRTTWP